MGKRIKELTPLEKTWVGLRIEYSKGVFVNVIDEDETHLLIQFDSGAKIASRKSSYKKPE